MNSSRAARLAAVLFLLAATFALLGDIKPTRAVVPASMSGSDVRLSPDETGALLSPAQHRGLTQRLDSWTGAFKSFRLGRPARFVRRIIIQQIRQWIFGGTS